jgi:hypothetical protein
MDIFIAFFFDFLFFDLGVSAHPRASYSVLSLCEPFVRLGKYYFGSALSAAHSPSGFPLKFRPLNHSRYFHLKFTFYSFVSEYSKIEFAGS